MLILMIMMLFVILVMIAYCDYDVVHDVDYDVV